jgi:hypothetical protein
MLIAEVYADDASGVRASQPPRYNFAQVSSNIWRAASQVPARRELMAHGHAVRISERFYETEECADALLRLVHIDFMAGTFDHREPCVRNRVANRELIGERR